MASSILPRFLRNQSQSAKKIIPLLNKQQIPLQTSPVLAHLFESEKSPVFQDSFLVPSETKNSSSPSQFFPIFNVGLFLNPISLTGLMEKEDLVVDDDVVSDGGRDSMIIWADSVKKKRKRKMNKHKLRKLRKRLRRKTKT